MQIVDRVVSNKDWVLHFQKADIKHLLIEDSNHYQILLRIAHEEKGSNMPFRFISAWTFDEFRFGVIQSAR